MNFDWKLILKQLSSRFSKSLLLVFLALLGYYFFKSLILKSLNVAQKGTGLKKEAASQRLATLTYLANSFLKFLFIIISLMMLLRIWGLDPTPLIASAGIVGVGLGFGAQTFIKDLISGFLILLENQFNVGDFVKIADAEGKVKKMTLRATYIEDAQGNIHIIPNSSIATVTRLKKKREEA